MKSIICMIFAFILILNGGNLLIESSVWFSNKTRIPSIIVGATIVSIATTFPELSVSFVSGIKGVETIAINTALGSMVCNLALVLGFSFIIIPSNINKTGLIGKITFFIMSLITLAILSLDKNINIFDAIILLLVFIGFIVSNLKSSNQSEETKTLSNTQAPNWFTIITQFFISTLAIGYGANVLVSGIDTLSSALNISQGLLGVFIISVGTNIPEFVTTLSALKMKNSDIAIGNIFGASIIDASLLIATTTLSSQNKLISIPIPLILLTLICLLVITLIISIPIIKKGKTSRLQGLLLVLTFVLYSLFLYKIS